MPRSKTEPVETYSLRLPVGLMGALRNIALAKGVNLSEVTRDAMETYVADFTGNLLEDLAADYDRREKAARNALAYREQQATTRQRVHDDAEPVTEAMEKKVNSAEKSDAYAGKRAG